MSSDRIIKAVVAGCSILLAAGVMAALNSPATGYESSIYTATPVLFWVLLGFTITGGSGIIVHQLHVRRHETSRLWTLGLLLLVLSYAAVLSLHIVRGYAAWTLGGDPASHLGEVQSIISTGHVSETNFYPIALIQAAQFSQVLDVEPLISLKALPLLFALVYAAFMYLLAKSVLPDKGAVILATAASLVFLHSSYLNFTPNMLANLLFPMALFLLIRSFGGGAWQWRGVAVIMAFLFPIFHPLPTVALAVVAVTLPAARVIFDRVAGKTRPIIDSSVKVGLAVLALLLVWSVAWLAAFPVSQGVISVLRAETAPIHDPDPDPAPAPRPAPVPDPIIETRPPPYTREAPPPPERATGRLSFIDSIIDDIRYTQAVGYSAARHIFNVYGAVFLYILLALISIFILWRRLRFQPVLSNLVSLYGPLAIIALAIVLLASRAAFFSPMRFLTYIVMLSTVVAGFALHHMIEKGRASYHSIFRRTAPPLLVALILLGSFGHGVARLYASPHVMQDNWQTTRSEMAGMDWVLGTKDQSLATMSYTRFLATRFPLFLLTSEERSRRQDIPALHRGYVPSPPPHFGYHEGFWLGENYADDMYKVLADRDRLRYVEVYPAVAKYRYYPEDFDRLAGDPTLDKLYSNGGFSVYYLHGVAPQPDTEQ